MTTDVTTHAVESVKLAADLQPDTAEALRALFESASPLVTPGFHGPLDIDTLVGLTGSYLWFEDPTNVRVIRFAFDSDKVGFQGRYTLSSGLFPVEQGTFNCVPNNPAIGFASSPSRRTGARRVLSRSTGWSPTSSNGSACCCWASSPAGSSSPASRRPGWSEP